MSEELIDELSLSHDAAHPVYRHLVHLFRQRVVPIDGDIGLVSEDIASVMEMQSSDRFFDYLIMCLPLVRCPLLPRHDLFPASQCTQPETR